MITVISLNDLVKADPTDVGNPLCPRCGDPYIGGPGCTADQCASTCGWCPPGECDGETCTDPNEKPRCVRCADQPGDRTCCSSHDKLLCHACYRRTHFVEVCVEGCESCAREGLPVVLAR